eukprot:TRINITY_DN5650_c0_g2_i2.p1 TRINITY_DN5650_c0_g2~~TRINITY_DN5650_c0_g2_i2.p1  ORF type:complete len:497 (-),score=58.43 TRINITY_DN5650_c0_g2_i2:991-2481(-)
MEKLTVLTVHPTTSPPVCAFPFIQKLHEILHTDSWAHAIHFTRNGHSILVADTERFTREVLPLYFKHSNLGSFIRQLNTYGFSKSSSSALEFTHPFFVQYRTDILDKIERKKSSRLPPHYSLMGHTIGSGNLRDHSRPQQHDADTFHLDHNAPDSDQPTQAVSPFPRSAPCDHPLRVDAGNDHVETSHHKFIMHRNESITTLSLPTNRSPVLDTDDQEAEHPLRRHSSYSRPRFDLDATEFKSNREAVQPLALLCSVMKNMPNYTPNQFGAQQLFANYRDLSEDIDRHSQEMKKLMDTLRQVSGEANIITEERKGTQVMTDRVVRMLQTLVPQEIQEHIRGSELITKKRKETSPSDEYAKQSLQARITKDDNSYQAKAQRTMSSMPDHQEAKTQAFIKSLSTLEPDHQPDPVQPGISRPSSHQHTSQRYHSFSQSNMRHRYATGPSKLPPTLDTCNLTAVRLEEPRTSQPHQTSLESPKSQAAQSLPVVSSSANRH